MKNGFLNSDMSDFVHPGFPETEFLILYVPGDVLREGCLKT